LDFLLQGLPCHHLPRSIASSDMSLEHAGVSCETLLRQNNEGAP
jgi:hypothetical protein